ncbi:hypothetical protein PTKIN_Ptkin10aG0111900 [Pterospermum kingtungense]
MESSPLQEAEPVQALLIAQVQIGNPVTGKAADLFTHFTFNISMPQPPNEGDGITFFIAPNGSAIPEYSWGGYLVLINNCSVFNTSGLVAVEFDTYQNEWDPSDNHIGDWKFELFLTYLENPIFYGNSSLSYEVNLSKVLPEWVSVGFSSSTGYRTEIHNILSWEFNSTKLSAEPDNQRELVRATNNFTEEGKLDERGLGGVYKGFLSSLNLNIAVKRVSKMSKQGKKEYIAEVKIISRLRHQNLVQLIGWCHEKGEFLLIYEFMPNDSLDSHLFGGQSPLSWALRYKIALGLASALLYLQEEWEQSVVHRDIKSSNVMLDSNFNARLGDFGLARLMDQEMGMKTTRPAGTFGYMAPEYVSKGKASKASDVYSFGVVALKIACGRRSIESKTKKEAKISLLDWVWRSYENGRIVNVADEKLYIDFDLEQMEQLVIVGLWCAHPDCNFRPSIRQALQVLNFEAPLPNLSKTMPIPKYDIPAASSASSSYEPLISNSIHSVGR